MKTTDKPSDLINQAITNLMGEKDAELLREKLWSCMKLATTLEIKKELNIKGKYKMENLYQAIRKAIEVAKEPNGDNFNAVCLIIKSNNTFEIGERTYSNTVYGGKLLLTSKNSIDCYCLTVTNKSYVGQDWSFDLMEFCGYYGIAITDRLVPVQIGESKTPHWN